MSSTQAESVVPAEPPSSKTFLLATRWERLGAFVIDLGVIIGMILCLNIALPLLAMGVYNALSYLGLYLFKLDKTVGRVVLDFNRWIAPEVGTLRLIAGFSSFFYFPFFTAKWGKTPGKMLLKIEVVSDENRKLSFLEVLLREIFGKYLSFILLGPVWILFNKRNKTAWDYLANSVVTQSPRLVSKDEILNAGAAESAAPAQNAALMTQTLASPMERLGAFLVDVAVIFGANATLGVLIGLLFLMLESLGVFMVELAPDSVEVYMIEGANLIWKVLYFPFFAAKWGATPGKMLLKLKVATCDDQSLSLRRILLREVVGKPVSMIVLGQFWVFFNGRKRAAWDYLAKTVVVKT